MNDSVAFATPSPLPAVLAGPLLRRLQADRVVIWLVGSEALTLRLELHPDGEAPRSLALQGEACRVLRIGTSAWLHLIDVRLDSPLPLDRLVEYDLLIAREGSEQGIADWAPQLIYEGAQRPAFVVRSRFDDLLHGSCRKPHHAAPDGLVPIDGLLAEARQAPESWPAALLMTGDQVYADDVAGPTLVAIHALIRRLGLYGECLEGAVVDDSDALMTHPASYYHREQLLPAFKSNEALRERFFGGVEKPVFTTSSAHNHLVSLGEVLAMYLLVWSPVPWQLIEPEMPPLDAELAERYAREAACMEGFRAGLPQVARVLAHLPSLMIFDDHDITDDWNLTARWEETAYGHPFSRRIIGNALLGYLLCQAWGNEPEAFEAPLAAVEQLLSNVEQGRLDCARHDEVVDAMLRWNDWGYVLPSEPALVVLDTRTRRWRSERNLNRPSGLMDWEALTDFQQHLLDHRSVIIVSPAPMFGVKLIETVQRVFSWLGQSLMVDAENWMAHRGAANVMLNIFRHTRTPGNYVILSGDVHYSFAYEVHIRGRYEGPRLWQITSSGVKNEFPRRLLDIFDRLNRWLYSPRSPLNWFTKRRRVRVEPWLPSRSESGERLWNSAGIGRIRLDAEGRPLQVEQINADGSPAVTFTPERDGR
ncbi:alkaline phosphatase D family protein [Stutzerimonas azotifigens]|uniref:Alkaline phosphatase family protein n=1 Tax=Stutzerimonas azotifigens TaxID=291995 RepID=A0ABR5Z5H0_9GAMM|nr:alkaline phosphatase D family protein [Stutzerimonas azotifigens]MBA1275404.1 alkaline phosphatase family protein [Stutzerimonas azotifigens]